MREGKEKKHTEYGDDVLVAAVAAQDTNRRGTRDCGSHDRDNGDDVDDDEVCIVCRELDAPELLLDADDEDAAAAAAASAWPCE